MRSALLGTLGSLVLSYQGNHTQTDSSLNLALFLSVKAGVSTNTIQWGGQALLGTLGSLVLLYQSNPTHSQSSLPLALFPPCLQ